MATYKVESLRVGPGSLIDTGGDSQIFVGTGDPVNGSPQPGVFPIGKDGDLYVKVNGGASTIFIKIGNVWQSLLFSPKIVILNDAQASPALAATYDATTLSYARVTYTIERVGDPTRQKAGQFIITADGTNNVLNYSHEVNELGNVDVGVTLTLAIVAGSVQIKYTSTADGAPVRFSYNVQGWSA